MHDGHPVGADLKFVGAANQRRGRADVCSKVIVVVELNTNSIVRQVCGFPSSTM